MSPPPHRAAAGRDAGPALVVSPALARLPRGRMPHVGMREILAALHRRRERRRESVQLLRHALEHLTANVERHLRRIGELRRAVEAHGGDLKVLEHYDTLMARLRAELRSTEKALADVFRAAATGASPPGD